MMINKNRMTGSTRLRKARKQAGNSRKSSAKGNDPRRAALEILVDTYTKKLPLDIILARFSEKLAGLSKQDRALTNAIIFGTLRWQGTLDWILSSFSNRPLEKLTIEILYILRTALYQIRYMDRIPVSAAVNSAVDIAKAISNPGAAGFVNAVLRKAGHNHSQVKLPPANPDPSHFISVTASFPQWLAKQWIHRWGIDKTLALCQSLNQIPPVTLRINPLRTDRDELAAQLQASSDTIKPTRYSDSGLLISRLNLPVHELDAFRKGLFQVQDEGAQLVTTLLDPIPGEIILDACAGLGGKSFHAAQLMKNQGTIIAMDTSKEKLATLSEEMIRLGITIITTRKADLLKTKQSDFKRLFDRVLLDAPCTGLGVLRRNPDTKWHTTDKDISRLARQQGQMLEKAAALVRPGGLLVYSVCSCEPRENEGVINPFLERNNQFSLQVLDKKRNRFPEGNDKFLKTYPDTTEMDGFFAAALKREA